MNRYARGLALSRSLAGEGFEVLLRGLVDSRGRLLLDLFSANFRRSLRGSRERSGLVKPHRKNRQNTRTLHGSLV